ncbi:hypothetical protein [Paenibacillus cremeus]|uniref:Uncharacterized protein n=1 Tax=Paenibacillus cremeus TaxID=2163881 RepID=A0A559JGK8_9BACL|nr:hypothetical protein [Paenibacillus cremeus]TVX99005.1 hypothetical protein FPZ49_34160 [Paenibacillus cremeus]
MLSSISIEEETAYVDSLIAHELGHASDVTVEENWNELKKHKARWKELLLGLIVHKPNDVADGTVSESFDEIVVKELFELYTSMKKLNVDMESRAWELGRNFCEYPAIYEKFNKENLSTYMKIYRVYEDILNNIHRNP